MGSATEPAQQKPQSGAYTGNRLGNHAASADRGLEATHDNFFIPLAKSFDAPGSTSNHINRPLTLDLSGPNTLPQPLHKLRDDTERDKAHRQVEASSWARASKRESATSTKNIVVEESVAPAAMIKEDIAYPNNSPLSRWCSEPMTRGPFQTPGIGDSQASDNPACSSGSSRRLPGTHHVPSKNSAAWGSLGGQRRE